eukprot:evm.model.scf_358EXC.5 EVM.evm.TU.scf_358EXC.5   scf_358EXC:65523-73674(+)
MDVVETLALVFALAMPHIGWAASPHNGSAPVQCDHRDEGTEIDWSAASMLAEIPRSASLHSCLRRLHDAATMRRSAGIRGGGREMPSSAGDALCACSALDFYDRGAERDASRCCSALRAVCARSSALACGHVHQFCTGGGEGYSAGVMDKFVGAVVGGSGRCGRFIGNATHGAAGTGIGVDVGVRRIHRSSGIKLPAPTNRAEKVGVVLATSAQGVRCVGADPREVSRCFERKQFGDPEAAGLRCGHGYCRHGSHCAEMSSENCRKIPQGEARAGSRSDGLNVDDCHDGMCSVCGMEVDFKCMFQNSPSSPCPDPGCADNVVCGDEEEAVCTLNKGVSLSAAISEEEQHKPEKVSASQRKKMSALIVPIAGVFAAAICSIALLSWITLRIKRAHRETVEQAQEEQRRFERENSVALSIHDESHPLTPGRQKSIPLPSPRSQLALSLSNLGRGGGEPEKGGSQGRPSGHRHSKSCIRKIWTPRTRRRSLSEADPEVLTCLPEEGIATMHTSYQISRSISGTRSRSIEAPGGPPFVEGRPALPELQMGEFRQASKGRDRS